MNLFKTAILFGIIFLVGVTSCNLKKTAGLKIVATAFPHAQMLEFIQSDLKSEGINLIIITADDYQMPNRALADSEVDGNFFQHLPFLQSQIKQFSYPIEAIAKIEIEPLGLYSKKRPSLKDFKDGDRIAIPNDPSNEARALLLLQENGIIQLKKNPNDYPTLIDIQENPYHFVFKEIDAALIPRILDEVEGAVINTNYALQVPLSPLSDALILEKGEDSPYVNVLVVRKDDINRSDIQKLKTALTSDKMSEFILKTYKGAVIPAFSSKNLLSDTKEN